MNGRLVCLVAVLVALGADAPRSLTLEVDAGPHDRRDAVVSLPLPDDLRAVASFRLESPDGGPVPCQVVAGDRPEVVWVLRDPLAAGSKRRYRLIPGAGPAERPGLALDARDGAATLRLDGREVFRYHAAVAEPPAGIDRLYRRSGFVHPIATRSGRVVTDDFPPDHAHQHGLFFAWVNTTFAGRPVDFWNQPKRTGTVGHDTARPGPVIAGGPVVSTLRDSLRHDALDPSGRATKILEEDWSIRAYDLPGLVVLDLESRQTCVAPEPLTINTYHYGGLGLRGNRAWGDPSAKGESPPDPAKSARSDFLTGEGKHRPDGNHTRPRWVDLHGDVDGRPAGVAILDHPANFRAPQPVRLHPNMPYFCFAPMVLGAFEIAPGTPYVSRYRIVAHDGPPDPKLLDRLWADYADPPRVTVVP